MDWQSVVYAKLSKRKIMNEIEVGFPIVKVTEDGVAHPLISEKDANIFNCVAAVINRWNNYVGWWKEDSNKAEKMMLMVSEISEAMEGNRKDLMDDHLPHRKMEEVEMADAIIRILDYCAEFNLDIGGAIREKFLYNMDRADHKKENRLKDGGKKY